MTRLLSGENAIDQIVAVCPCSGSPTFSPVDASHNCTMDVRDPEAMYLPSGETATASTVREYSGEDSGFVVTVSPVSKSHILTVPS